MYELGTDFIPRAQVSPLPVVSLGDVYKKISEFEARLPYPLGLREAGELTVEGDWSFGRDVTVVGDVTLGAEGGVIADGSSLREAPPQG